MPRDRFEHVDMSLIELLDCLSDRIDGRWIDAFGLQKSTGYFIICVKFSELPKMIEMRQKQLMINQLIRMEEDI